MVPGAGLEPARLAAGDFESPESTNFTTRAVFVKTQIMAYFLADFAPCFEISVAAAKACQDPLVRWRNKWAIGQERAKRLSRVCLCHQVLPGPKGASYGKVRP